MADDLTDLETAMGGLQGVENHPYGVILVRAVRLLRAARTKFAATDARLAALEGSTTTANTRLLALEGATTAARLDALEARTTALEAAAQPTP
jgi:hypothetical protein